MAHGDIARLHPPQVGIGRQGPLEEFAGLHAEAIVHGNAAHPVQGEERSGGQAQGLVEKLLGPQTVVLLRRLDSRTDVRPREVVDRSRVRRVQLQRLLEVVDRGFEISQPVLQDTQVRACPGVFRVEPEGLLEQSFGFRRSLKPDHGVGQGVVNPGIAGGELFPFIEIAQGLLGTTLLEQHEVESLAGDPVEGIDADGLAIERQGLLGIPLGDEQIGQLGVDLGVPGTQLAGPVEKLPGGGKVPRGLPEAGEAGQGGNRGGVGLEGLLVAGVGFWQPTQRLQFLSQAVGCERIGGGDFDGVFKQGDGLFPDADLGVGQDRQHADEAK